MDVYIKFIYSEMATNFWEVSTVDLTVTTYNIGQIYGGDFTKFCGLLRIYELYIHIHYSSMLYFANTYHIL